MTTIFQKILLFFIISSGAALFSAQNAFEQYKPWQQGFKDLVIQCADSMPATTTPLEKHIENSPLTLGSGKNKHHHPVIIQTQENNVSITKTINEFYQLIHLSPHYSQEGIKNCLQQVAETKYPYTGPFIQQQTNVFLQKLLPTQPSTTFMYYAKAILPFYNITQRLANSEFYRGLRIKNILQTLAITLITNIYVNSEFHNNTKLPLSLEIIDECNKMTMRGLFYTTASLAMFYFTIKLFSTIFSNCDTIQNLPLLEKLYKNVPFFTKIFSKYQEDNQTTKKGSVFKNHYNNKPSLHSLKTICSFLKLYYKNLEKKYVQYLKNEHLINHKANSLDLAYLSLLSNINSLEETKEKNGLSGFSWASIELANPGSTTLFKQRFTLPVLEDELMYEKENYNALLHRKMLQIQPHIQKLMIFNTHISHILQQVELLSKPQDHIPTTILKKLYTWWYGQ